MPAVEVRAERPLPEVLVAAQAPQAPAVSTPQPDPHRVDNGATAREVAVETDSPTAAELITRSMQIASLSADISPQTRAHSKRPRHKYINAHTQAYKYASYMEAWRAKVERVGNLNYPQEARQGRLSGSLILDVALDADGNVLSAEVVRSSGYKALDDGAVRIVYLAAPFAPLPKAIREETDVLHITRTWQFRDGDHLSSE